MEEMKDLYGYIQRHQEDLHKYGTLHIRPPVDYQSNGASDLPRQELDLTCVIQQPSISSKPTEGFEQVQVPLKSFKQGAEQIRQAVVDHLCIAKASEKDQARPSSASRGSWCVAM